MTAQYESIKRKVEISIHTNARWWHSSIQDLPDIIPISIHTTVRWWLINRRWPCAYSNFNPHHRKVVTSALASLQSIQAISIHTIARWWRSSQEWELSLILFQSTPPQGGDWDGVIWVLGFYDFNPHHRKVVTCWGIYNAVSKCNFNPHHRKVVTVPIVVFYRVVLISIHTTARWWLVWDNFI